MFCMDSLLTVTLEETLEPGTSKYIKPLKVISNF